MVWSVKIFHYFNNHVERKETSESAISFPYVDHFLW